MMLRLFEKCMLVCAEINFLVREAGCPRTNTTSTITISDKFILSHPTK